MKIKKFCVDSTTKSWILNQELSFLSSELNFLTEGIICFSDDSSSFDARLYLLEFWVELKLLLLRRLGQINFKTDLVLQDSGDYFKLTKNANTLTIQYSSTSNIVVYQYSDFIDASFSNYSAELKTRLADCFPSITKLPEWKILFD